jgi:5'-deoxy-5'-methylthioadenosine phosphorylase
MIDLAIIGGTSLQTFKKLENIKRTIIRSSYGQPSSSLHIGNIHGKRIAFLNRHGDGYKIPPHKVNYQANIDILDIAGVKKVIAVNAVGGISEFAGPLHISVPEQIIDYTYGREHTFFNGGESGVNFVDFSTPFSQSLRDKLVWTAHDLRLHVKEAGFSSDSCYACTQGPRLETAAEIKRLAQDGCDIVGMTMMPEAVLAREKKMEYTSVCMVVNWAAGLIDRPITMVEIQRLIAEGSGNIETLLDRFIRQL